MCMYGECICDKYSFSIVQTVCICARVYVYDITVKCT